MVSKLCFPLGVKRRRRGGGSGEWRGERRGVEEEGELEWRRKGRRRRSFNLHGGRHNFKGGRDTKS